MRFLARVENIAPYLRSAALEVAPLLHGLGTRIKILEALSFGKPVVATQIGGYGIDVSEEDGLFLGDDPKVMAEVCLSLMEDAARRVLLGRRGKERVYALYGREVLNRRMQEIVEAIG